MNLDKKKVFFIGIVTLLLAFIVSYALWGLEEEPASDPGMVNPETPKLSEESREYRSRMEAVDGLREERNNIPPSLYPEEKREAARDYDPYLEETKKQALMDSILQYGPDIENYDTQAVDTTRISRDKIETDTTEIRQVLPELNPGQGHPEFFFGSKAALIPDNRNTGKAFSAIVNGDQVVRKDERLELLLMEEVVIGSDTLAKNSLLYAGCSFRANRLLLAITLNTVQGGKLLAYDLSDGLEGIYIENSFQSQATTEVLDDVIQDINISGVPQVSGLKGIFQRSNRNVKVKVLHQHQLILKPAL